MKTIFLRVIEAPVDEKAEALRSASRSADVTHRFETDATSFRVVPKSPFAYWVSKAMRTLFVRLQPFEADGRTAKHGAATLDDVRFVRFWTEIQIGRSSWVPFAKGGTFSPYYADILASLDWDDNGRELKAFVAAKVGSASRTIQATDYYLRPGLTWPLRGIRFSAQAVPAGCIFSVAGKMAFVPDNAPTSWLALFNSEPFDGFIAFFAGKVGGVQYESGLIANVPVPDVSERSCTRLGALARRAWSLKRAIDTRNEISHALVLPALLQARLPADELTQSREAGKHIDPLGVLAPLRETTLDEQATRWAERIQATDAELIAIQSEIDELSFDLYGIDHDDRRAITQGLGASTETDDGEPEDAEDDDEGDEAETPQADMTALAEELLSWTVGVAFGRFDVRLATGERELPPEPEPFDPLPVCSPGMLTGDDGLPLARPPAGYPIAFPEDGVLTGDVGHARDLLTAVRQVFDVVFQEGADAWWRDVGALLDPKEHDVRAYLATRFFEPHLKRYSKSRRKAPIYWQLATPSARYSVWLYAHRVTKETFFHLLHDVVRPKLAHEQAQLTSLIQNAGPNPTASQRKQIEPQEALVGELQAMVDELERVAPLWNPNLDDGIVLVMAPLWRLVSQHAAWQKELRTKWEELCDGRYDWAHIAMHLWPERVVPTCQDDRSLAIAHGLEDELWVETEDGKWKQREVDRARIEALIAERTSPAVKAALASLLSAPSPKGSARKRGSRAAKKRATPATPSPAKASADLDEATLATIRHAIAQVAGGASKSDVLAATGISNAEWTRAIALLLERGEVTQSGQKRGTRYHALDTSSNGGSS